MGKQSAHWRDAKRARDWDAMRAEITAADWVFREAVWLGNTWVALKADHSDGM